MTQIICLLHIKNCDALSLLQKASLFAKFSDGLNDRPKLILVKTSSVSFQLGL